MVTLNTNFDSVKTKARFNYLIDVLRGCWNDRDEFVQFDDMKNNLQQMYYDEADIDEYVITEENLDDIEGYLNNIINENK